MEVRQRIIENYIAPDGRKPFWEWLDALKDSEARAKIRIRLIRLQLGNFGDSKFIGHGVFELRIDFGPGYRVYFGQKGMAIVVLLIGGDKQSQQKDIRKAQEYWRDYNE